MGSPRGLAPRHPRCPGQGCRLAAQAQGLGRDRAGFASARGRSCRRRPSRWVLCSLSHCCGSSGVLGLHSTVFTAPVPCVPERGSCASTAVEWSRLSAPTVLVRTFAHVNWALLCSPPCACISRHSIDERVGDTPRAGARGLLLNSAPFSPAPRPAPGPSVLTLWSQSKPCRAA